MIVCKYYIKQYCHSLGVYNPAFNFLVTRSILAWAVYYSSSVISSLTTPISPLNLPKIAFTVYSSFISNLRLDYHFLTQTSHGRLFWKCPMMLYSSLVILGLTIISSHKPLKEGFSDIAAPSNPKSIRIFNAPLLFKWSLHWIQIWASRYIRVCILKGRALPPALTLIPDPLPKSPCASASSPELSLAGSSEGPSPRWHRLLRNHCRRSRPTRHPRHQCRKVIFRPSENPALEASGRFSAPLLFTDSTLGFRF